MGVLNVTPDSFYDGGDFDSLEKAVEQAVKMEKEGASVIDIGGESTRPGSEKISLEEELDRVIPVIEAVKEKVNVPISIDTYKPEIAEAAVESGAEIVNDIYALRKKGMARTVAELDVPVIIMHMQGTPETMQDNPSYDDVITEVYGFLQYRAKEAEKAGISPENIVIDPGIGFGKRTEHNLEIINRLDEFTCMGYPVLLGASRKRYLAGVLDKDVDERLFGTVAVSALAVSKSVSILRVHDVEENLDALKTIRAITEV
ncbi:MAG: dihydropteroate synthase [Thermoplasmata archaeon]